MGAMPKELDMLSGALRLLLEGIGDTMGPNVGWLILPLKRPLLGPAEIILRSLSPKGVPDSIVFFLIVAETGLRGFSLKYSGFLLK